MRKKRAIGAFLTILLVSVLAAGCGLGKDDTDYTSPEILGFTIPAQAHISDFDWFFKLKAYDRSGEESFTNPYDAEGIWECVNWHKPDKKSGSVKDVYWMNIEIEHKNGSLGNGADIDPEIAAEVYAYQAFMDSDEAAAGGFSGSDTTAKLLEALGNMDPGVKCMITIVRVGREDSDGNWSTVNNEKPVQYEGEYYPDYLFIKAEDAKGNRITINNFLKNGDMERALITYEVAKNEYFLNGMGTLYRNN